VNKRSRTTWAKLVLALGLMCLTFSIGAIAQSSAEQPLDEDAVSELFGELSFVLVNEIKDSALKNTISERWYARNDLVGKTKTQALKLLFSDVKSVIKDPAIQNKIWSAWNEKEEVVAKTPDESPTKPATPAAKPPHQLPNEVRPDQVNLLLIGEKFDGSPWVKSVVDGNLQVFNPSTVDIQGYPLENQPAYDCERVHGAGNCVKVVGYYAENTEHGYDYVDRYVKRCAAGLVYYGLTAAERAIRCGRPDFEIANNTPAKSAIPEVRAVRPIGSWNGPMAWDEKVRITEFFEVAEVCSDADKKTLPGARFAVGGRCYRNMREAIPSNNSPTYYCEKVHGVGNCELVKDTVVVGLRADHEDRQWAIKKCSAGFQFYSENLKFNETSSFSGNWEYRLYCARNKK